MRRESSTVVAVVGDVSSDLLVSLARSPNVSVTRPPATAPAAAQGTDAPKAPRSGLESAAEAMREAARQRAMYVVIPADPLADVAAAWQQMWDPAAASAGAAEFESSAALALAAWRARRFELPDYYLVVAPAYGSRAVPDLYLGPLRAARPRRVAVAAVAAMTAVGASAADPGSAAGPASAADPASLLDALRSLEQGPWWPPLDELIDVARGFYAGGLAETQQLAT